jgi:tetratricopeptide (TPR) repeat protein
VTTHVFVARERELAHLQTFLTRALEGQGQVVFVAGEAGSGKTAVLREFARLAQDVRADLVVAVGECNAQTGIGDPYLPFREILGMFSGDVDAKVARGAITLENANRLRALLHTSGQALVEVGPVLINTLVPGTLLLTMSARFLAKQAGWLKPLEKLNERKSATPSESGQEQSHLFEQYTNVLKAIATKQPLILVVDDLQWADAGSISLLFHLGRRIGESHILLVGAYRPAEVALGRGDARHPMEKVLAEFKRYLGDVVLDLDQSAESENRQFVDAFLDTEPNCLGNEFREALFRHTDGHALFTVELLRTMQERGDLQRDEQGRWVASHTLDWGTLPARVEGVIEERIGRLEKELREILRVASVEGNDFTAQAIARVQELRERQLLRDLSEELDKRHRLVHERGETSVGSQVLSHYQFANTLFQQYLYNNIGSGERRLLHGEIARVLEVMYAAHTESIAVQLAHHFAIAGNRQKTIEYSIKAGDSAASVFAWTVATRHYTTAFKLLEQQEEDFQQRANVLSKLALMAVCQSDPDASLEYAQSALALYEKLGDKRNVLQMHMEISRLYSGGYWDGAREVSDQALKHLEAAASITEDGPDTLEKGQVFQRTAHLYLHRVQPVIALDWARKAIALFARLGVPMGTSLGTALTYAGQIDEGIAYNEKNWDAVLKAGNPVIIAILGHELSLTLALIRDIPKAKEWAERILPLVSKAGPLFESMLRRPLAFIYALSGEVSKARESCQMVQGIESKTRLACIYEDAAGVGFHYLRQGEWEKAKDYLDKSLSIFRERNNLAAVCGCSFVLGNLNLEMENHAQAEELLLGALAMSQQGGNVLCELWILPVLVELYLKVGQDEKAAEYLKRGFELLKPDRNWYGLAAPLYMAKGMFASTHQNWDEAVHCFDSALVINRQYQLPYDEAKGLYEWGRMYLARNGAGDRENARRKFESALEIFQRVGARRNVDQVLASTRALEA